MIKTSGLKLVRAWESRCGGYFGVNQMAHPRSVEDLGKAKGEGGQKIFLDKVPLSLCFLKTPSFFNDICSASFIGLPWTLTEYDKNN